jgi:hypothetical protein
MVTEKFLHITGIIQILPSQFQRFVIAFTHCIIQLVQFYTDGIVIPFPPLGMYSYKRKKA